MENPMSLDYPEEIGKICQKLTYERKSISSVNSGFTEIPLEDLNENRKLPKRILNFNDGCLEEYSTEEEFEDNDTEPLIDTKTLPWIPYLWYFTTWLGYRALAVCDYLGEHLAYFFGITSPKFQYEIEEYQRMVEKEAAAKKKEQEENAGWGDDGNKNCSINAIQTEPSSVHSTVCSQPPITEIAKESNYTNSPQWNRY